MVSSKEGGHNVAELTKEKKIKKELAKLKKILADIDEDRKKAVEKLIGNVAFMAVTLDELQDAINEKGCIEEYQNGNNQFGYKESSEIKVYNSLIKNYTTSMKQLLDQLPVNIPLPEDGFDKFIRKKSDKA